MTMDPALFDLFPDEVTIEPFSSETSARVVTYGASVTYRAQIVSEFKRVIDSNGRDMQSSARVLIPERVHIDARSRITLPTGWVPNQPPILSIRPVGGVASMSLDSTEIVLG